MADAEEPQFNTLAERIAALNKQKNFSTTTPEPARKRPPGPPPPPPGRPVVDARTQSLPVVSSSGSPPGHHSPAIPPRPNRRNNAPSVPGQNPSVALNGTQHHHQSPVAAPPPLPSRSPSSQPTLPPRRTLTQPPSLTVRRNSGSSEISQHSTLSSLSLGGHTASSVTSQGSEGTIYKLPPAFDAASLPPLPPSKREREAKEAKETAEAIKQAARPKYHKQAAQPIPASRQVEPAPAPKPSLPPRLPSRPAIPPRNATVATTEPNQPPRKLPPRPMGFAKSTPTNGTSTQSPGVRPALPSRPQSHDEPPPVPASSRPSFAQIEAASRAPPPIPVVDDCFICRDWSGPDTVAAQFPRQSLPRNDPVGHLAHGLCDPFPSYTNKARAIFTWFHHNIVYDTVAFFGNSIKHMSVEDTIFSGKAVCQGYAEVYKAIANRAGLECVLVSGHGKGYGYTPLKEGERPPPPKPDGHAWNAVRIDGGEWKLLDACWGAGHLDGHTNQYKQTFSPTHFNSSNDKFGRSHFPRESKYQFRNDGRVISWEEYFVGPKVGQVNGERPTFYTGAHEEGFCEDTVEPKGRDIPVYSGEVVRFQFSKICEHWTSEKHGRGKPPLLLLCINGVDGRKDDMLPMETDGYWHWIDVNARDLGAPGQSVKVAQPTSIDGQDARGVTAKEFLAKKGKVGMAWSYDMSWELV
ncbi:hypothetical protein BGZ61DRAFT_472025 [Ilyonectria robusta]|uniref:uncharacterized protein n=1 Tax=Ilyonectria robusta TaxID=1079257 RepID=UPI001E8DA57F|nr:uncharacterized protein BGZ61DRAFT_472025 [Ilyonectria robusta]KAH8735611.1 hypothetical protein BGZ61DRAFT_472025 [Ilyonectria robusta]